MKALLALYRVMDTTALDTETVAATYRVSNRVAENAFEAAVGRGLLESESGLYLLTAKGENEIDDLFIRGGGAPLPARNRATESATTDKKPANV